MCTELFSSRKESEVAQKPLNLEVARHDHFLALSVIELGGPSEPGKSPVLFSKPLVATRGFAALVLLDS